ncbi:glycoside hydrolase family 9 protein [Paractinoplanes lichenicola]|uniref:Glycoside hydrolase family 9 protein n=1 Tax=Paractinoplanes lichenicola TaxID=2802976 RepID=A0ABS1VW19_9ACTN|nr:glycoside hydrolase family 9 protein [Actinoplanes lichenicola]MBL7258657.1 glycoside hydrolase family 9 protein [Actinoplanes lichenicola]
MRSPVLVALGILLLVLSSACDRPSAPGGVIRVDQVGYAPGEAKIAYLLWPGDAADVRVTVVDAYGKQVLTPRVGAGRGAWNARFADVRPIDLSGLRTPGVYRVRASGVSSPPFRISDAASLFGPAARDALSYFENHRDGANQASTPWARPPAHLSDRSAFVYDRVLTRVGGPVDVEGGWYDAGDFLKFTHTTAYALSAMLLAERDGLLGAAPEIDHGLTWLGKMWDSSDEVLYTQVGIGSGTGGFLGDHDTWRLPETDDQLEVQPGDRRYYQRYRPVFRAAAPGDPISPNLAGRVAAAFALAAQVRPDRAQDHLDAAARIYSLARTTEVGELVTAEPRSFYPEDRWTDDLAFGATELALAGRALGDPRTQQWTADATKWTRSNAGGSGPLSVYDVSALADAELIRLTGPAPWLLADLRQRLDTGVRAAAANPLGAAAGDGGYDYAARQLGYVATALLYGRASGDSRYAAFATAQRGVVLGANGWGTSLVVGVGTTYPRCPHDQIATLSGEGLPMAGAVVNGPNRADRVRSLQSAGPSLCRNDAFAAFDRPDTHFTDDSRISANTEPAIDFSATGLLAFALTSRQP